jgi:hypothetical protein
MPTNYKLVWGLDIPRLQPADWALFAQHYPDAMAWLLEAALLRELDYMVHKKGPRSQWHKNRLTELRQGFADTPPHPEILALYTRRKQRLRR